MRGSALSRLVLGFAALSWAAVVYHTRAAVHDSGISTQKPFRHINNLGIIQNSEQTRKQYRCILALEYSNNRSLALRLYCNGQMRSCYDVTNASGSVHYIFMCGKRK